MWGQKTQSVRESGMENPGASPAVRLAVPESQLPSVVLMPLHFVPPLLLTTATDVTQSVVLILLHFVPPLLLTTAGDVTVTSHNRWSHSHPFRTPSPSTTATDVTQSVVLILLHFNPLSF